MAPPPTGQCTVVGVVIAGGRSERFGGEKAVAPLRGVPLLVRALECVRRACAEVAVNARAGSGADALARSMGLTVLADAAGDPRGPLAGVRAGLHWALERGARTLAVCPCDAPMLPTDLFARLVAAAGEGAAFAETAGGAEPLCAVWPVGALPALERSLAGGAHPPIRAVLASLGAARVWFEDPAAFANVNTRADLERLEGDGVPGRTYQS